MTCRVGIRTQQLQGKNRTQQDTYEISGKKKYYNSVLRTDVTETTISTTVLWPHYVLIMHSVNSREK